MQTQYITPEICLESKCEAIESSDRPTSRKGRAEVPISEKCLLTLEEAAAYTGIGICKLREMSNDERCDFVLWNGTKRMLKKTNSEHTSKRHIPSNYWGCTKRVQPLLKRR